MISQTHPRTGKIDTNRSNFLYLTLFFHVLVACQILVIAPIFNQLYLLAEGALLRYLIALPLVMITALHVPKFRKPSDLGVALLTITPVTPAYAYFVVHGGSQLYVLSVFLGFLAFSYIRLIKFPFQLRIEIRIGHLLILCFLLLLAVVASAAQSLKINSISEIILDLYDVRSQVSIQRNPILNYLQGWVYAVIIPFLFLYFFVKRSYLVLTFLFSILIVFFLMLTGKSIIATPFILITIYLILRVNVDFSRLYLLIMILMGISSAIYFISGNLFAVSVFVRRVLYVPAMLNHHYHELFSEIGFVYYSHSVFSFLSDYPFQQSYQTLVGSYVFGNSLAHANTGIFGTGYMHFGYPGVIVFAAIVGMIAAFVDSTKVARLEPRFAGAVFALPVSTIFSSADLFSGMLTNGLLVAALLLAACGALDLRITPSPSHRRKGQTFSSTPKRADGRIRHGGS